MGEPILRMTGITKRFVGVKALDNVDFELRAGEVRALIGENGAGKSTLMNVLLGIHRPDEGNIEFLGKPAHFREPKDALNAGISMIHQEISLIPTIDVAENIWMGREDHFMSGGVLINTQKRFRQTQALLDRLGIRVDPRVKVGLLSVAMMQLVELARAVSYDAKIIIMDEPTSALTNEEVELLYKIVKDLSRQGVAIVFISHKIEEIFSICESVTVLRDGCTVGTRPIDQRLSMNDLINMIVGRELTDVFAKTPLPMGDVVLEVKHLCRENVFSDVNFKIRAGEIVGFSGLLGAGRSEIARAIFGIDKVTGGEILINGRPVRIGSPKKAIRLGLGMVTEDRLRLGAIFSMSIKQNLTLANLFRYAKMSFISRKAEDASFYGMAKKLSIKYAVPSDSISTLSGGNQQKVIVGRWLLTDPKILILDEPTRGIDVGSKAEIYKLIHQLAAQGLAILFISSEMPEIMSLCDHTYVIRNGRCAFDCYRDDMTQELLAQHAFGLQTR